jgi:type VI secretion system protein ImpA
MASSAILDLDALLAAIPGENRAGESVRYSGVYDAIQEARRADEELPMGDWQREVKSADWHAVIHLTTEALGNKSKDLQLGAWLVEALAKQRGFAGVRDGLNLLREMHEQFWEGLYPEMQDGDLEFRAGPLNWLNEKLPASIREIALTEGDPPYSWNHWDESRKVDNLGRQNPDAMQAAIAEGKVSGEQFDKSAEATERAFYENLFEDLAQAKEQLSRLERTVEEKFAQNAPSFIKVRNALDDCHQVVVDIVKKKRVQDPNYKPPTDDSSSSNGRDTGTHTGHEYGRPMTAPSAASWPGEPRSREEAFQRLAAIAAYLKRVEPQHPVSYLLERAVRWTSMPLEDWLGEVIHSEEVLGHLRDTLGIKDRQNA